MSNYDPYNPLGGREPGHQPHHGGTPDDPASGPAGSGYQPAPPENSWPGGPTSAPNSYAAPQPGAYPPPQPYNPSDYPVTSVPDPQPAWQPPAPGPHPSPPGPPPGPPHAAYGAAPHGPAAGFPPPPQKDNSTAKILGIIGAIVGGLIILTVIVCCCLPYLAVY